MSAQNRERAEWYARAEFYAWSARKGFPYCGRDPLTGCEWDGPGADAALRRTARMVGRAANRALAVECYRIARRYPSPVAS